MYRISNKTKTNWFFLMYGFVITIIKLLHDTSVLMLLSVSAPDRLNRWGQERINFPLFQRDLIMEREENGVLIHILRVNMVC